MRYNLFTDPHLGTRRQAHTTRESSQRLSNRLFTAAEAALHPKHPNLCLGDLFDRAHNEEAILVQGHRIAERCELVIAGNHDETNREGSVSTLRALGQMGSWIVAQQGLSEPRFHCHNDGIYVVPHHASQVQFEQALMQAGQHALNERAGKPAVLLLHCNYASDFATQDATLNLTEEMAASLIGGAFDMILLGHEHQPATYKGGRVVVLGNVHPTSFHDISDKYRYSLDISDDHVSLHEEKIWSIADGYREISFGAGIPDLTGVQFVDVVGLGKAEDAVALADFINQIWRSGPDLCAVRNQVQIGNLPQILEEVARPALVDLKATIGQELAGTDMLPLFEEIVAEVQR
jgi:DNA repair exonuclease SbcCD nuclease subunit